ncbi:hypothetical protein CC86DRAFT_401229 [Ophiobolus disseminans]|uniref:Uncharacterized protein n=1 Tax=Ophiobolus disseminans TaxID=1469910 RepID=A0A6A7AIQ0_9PLEO|nr:hypothetical protein CC86DRAFT_401229 [Ophiobolus disseminans]
MSCSRRTQLRCLVPTRFVPEDYPKRWLTVDVPPIPPLAALAQCNAQLRAETLQRAARLDTPLILDILFLENGYVKCTWISRPCAEPTKWQKIDMKVQIRTQPVSVKLWNAYCPVHEMYVANNSNEDDETDNMRHFHWNDDLTDSDLVFLILVALSKAVICVLWASAPSKHLPSSDQGKILDRDNIVGPVNSIKHLSIETMPARNDEGKVVSSAYQDMPWDLNDTGYPDFDPNDSFQHFANTLRYYLDMEWGAGPSDVPFVLAGCYETARQPFLTHIGSFSIGTPGQVGDINSVYEILQVYRHDFDDDVKVEGILLLRKEMGWHD